VTQTRGTEPVSVHTTEPTPTPEPVKVPEVPAEPVKTALPEDNTIKPEDAVQTPGATEQAMTKAFEDGKVIRDENGAEFFTAKTPEKTQATLGEVKKDEASGKGPKLLGRNEAMQIAREFYPDKVPYLDAFHQAGAAGKQLVTDYTETVTGWQKGTVDDFMSWHSDGKSGSATLFNSKEQAMVAAEVHRRLNPTHEISDPYPVTITKETKKGTKTETKWQVTSRGTRQVDPFAIGMRYGEDGTPKLYAMSYNYNSTKAGNVRSYLLNQFHETASGFDASKIDLKSPYANDIKAITERANQARQVMLDSLPQADALRIMNHIDQGRRPQAKAALTKALRDIPDPAKLEELGKAFETWCAR
jgi:hypothetical protein